MRVGTPVAIVVGTAAVVVAGAVADGDGYPELARERFVLVLHGAAPAAVEVDGRRQELVGDRVELINAGTGFSARFEA